MVKCSPFFGGLPKNGDARDAPSGSIVTLPHPRAAPARPGLTAARAIASASVSKPRKACGEQLAGSGEMFQARPDANEGVNHGKTGDSTMK